MKSGEIFLEFFIFCHLLVYSNTTNCLNYANFTSLSDAPLYDDDNTTFVTIPESPQAVQPLFLLELNESCNYLIFQNKVALKVSILGTAKGCNDFDRLYSAYDNGCNQMNVKRCQSITLTASGLMVCKTICDCYQGNCTLMMISHQYLSSIGWNVCEIDAMTMEPEITNTENDMTAHTEQTTTPAINAAEISETSWVIGASSCGGHCASSNSPEHIEVSVNGKIVYDGSDIGFHFVQIGRNTGEVVDSKVFTNCSEAFDIKISEISNTNDIIVVSVLETVGAHCDCKMVLGKIKGNSKTPQDMEAYILIGTTQCDFNPSWVSEHRPVKNGKIYLETAVPIEGGCS